MTSRSAILLKEIRNCWAILNSGRDDPSPPSSIEKVRANDDHDRMWILILARLRRDEDHSRFDYLSPVLAGYWRKDGNRTADRGGGDTQSFRNTIIAKTQRWLFGEAKDCLVIGVIYGPVVSYLYDFYDSSACLTGRETQTFDDTRSSLELWRRRQDKELIRITLAPKNVDFNRTFPLNSRIICIRCFKANPQN